MKKQDSFFSPYDEFVRQITLLATKSVKFAQLLEQLKAGELKIAPQTMYFTERASDGGGDITISPEGKQQAYGVRSLTGNILETGFFFLPVKIEVLGAAGVATATDEALRAGDFTAIDAAALNGDLFIENDSQVFIDRLSLHTMENADKSLYLTNSKIFKEQSKTIIRLHGMPAVVNTAYKVILHGIGTRP